MTPHTRRLLTPVPALLLAAAAAGPAFAAASTGHFAFYDCTGPAPSSFTALKEDLPAAEGGTSSAAVAYRLDDGSGVFVVQSFSSHRIGKGIPDSNLVVSCQIDFDAGTFTFSGFIAPR
jgi:hypothetical protein